MDHLSLLTDHSFNYLEKGQVEANFLCNCLFDFRRISHNMVVFKSR